MRKTGGWIFMAAAMAAGLWASVSGAAGGGGATPIPYRTMDGYRSWTHVKSMLIHDPSHPLHGSFGGLHHVYANPAAVAALRAGGTTFPDGAALVFDLLDAKNAEGAYVEGARKFTAIMVKDAKAFASTGGWGFQAYKGDSQTDTAVTDAATQCFACHQSRKANDYVFSEFRK